MVLYFGKARLTAGQAISGLPGGFYRGAYSGIRLHVKISAPASQALYSCL